MLDQYNKMIQSAQQSAKQSIINQDLRQQDLRQQDFPQQGPNPVHNKALRMLGDRLGTVDGYYKQKIDDFIACHVDTERRVVFVFFVFSGESGHTSEEINIFPSDKLITQLRMIMK
jgi:hypothetical protein